MKRLIKIEWLKISRNRVFWVTLAAYILTILMILWGIRSAIISINKNVAEATHGMTILPADIYTFPHVWHNITFLAKYVKIFLGILMILLVTNEFYYNTMRQNIINGMTRLEFVWSKFIDAILLALFSTAMLFVFSLITGLVNTKHLAAGDIFSKMEFIPGYFLMISAYLSFIMMLAVLLRKAVLTMGILLAWGYILEPILAWKFADSFGPYLPIQCFNGLIVAPKTPLFTMMNVKTASNGIDLTYTMLTVIYMALFFFVSYWVLRKRDL